MPCYGDMHLALLKELEVKYVIYQYFSAGLAKCCCITISATMYRNRTPNGHQILSKLPTVTVVLRRFLMIHAFYRKPANVQHILNQVLRLREGSKSRQTLFDFLGNGIFNIDGDSWKFQRQVSSHEFNTKSLRKFVETVVDTKSLTLNPDSLHCCSYNQHTSKIRFRQHMQDRFEHEYLLPDLPETEFAKTFDDAAKISSGRFATLLPFLWKIKRFLNIGSEKRLKEACSDLREFARNIIKEKKQELSNKPSLETVDLLSRFLSSGHSDEDFVTDIVISFILAGRDTTSAALTWYFWLLSQNPEIEKEILREIKDKSESPVYEEVKDMVYTHASLCESMRLYPPVPIDGKRAGDGVGNDGKWSFVGRDPYSYPVFQAGPRICLGKDMAFLQMKRVVAGILRRFKVVPAAEDGFEPVFVSFATSKMEGGFPVRNGKPRTSLELINGDTKANLSIHTSMINPA
uniref:Cytochrome P450 n=1 Tax=Salix viminalis TaxID=40686 RepID=A0A6N2LCC9_SALVM